jgi:hypothetical protein
LTKSSNQSTSYRRQSRKEFESLKWLDENRENYSGQWVALDGDRLLASGPTAKEVYSKAKAKGVEIPFIELVTDLKPVYRRMAFVS